MTSTVEGAVVDAFRTWFGNDLWGVIKDADRNEFEVRYLREDLASYFDEARQEDVA